MGGPVIVFDKSTLQSLTVDESCWLDRFFVSNITPILYVETLADVAKERKGERTSQEIVAELATKTPSVNCFPNVDHRTLCVGNLLGFPVSMQNRPLIGGGQWMRSAFGTGIHYQQHPATEALHRWQLKEFLTVEKDFASSWRHQLHARTFEQELALAHEITGDRFRDFAEVKRFADGFVQRTDSEPLYAVLATQGVPVDCIGPILGRWDRSCQPPLSEFAPFAAHALRVDVFFLQCLASGLIGKRPSNKEDMAYLYYLPFTMIFASTDRLHARTAPLFMDLGQVFVPGEQLKAALAQLDAYYWGLPNAVKEQSIITIAPYPPEGCETLVSDLWHRFLPHWRESASRTSDAGDEMTAPYLQEAIGKATAVEDSAERGDGADYALFQSVVERKKGRWVIVPEEPE